MQPTVPGKCTKCHAPLANPLVCSACRTLHTPTAISNFELFGLQQSYQVDSTRLTTAFRALARQIHPDRFAGASEESRTLATHLTARMNEAFDLLNDPVQRANYLLELAGGPSAIEVRDVPGTLLMEVMELREQLEEAQNAGDLESITSMRLSVSDQKQQALSEIASRADSLSTSGDSQKREFRKLLNAMRYYENLLDDLAIDPLAATGTGAP